MFNDLPSLIKPPVDRRQTQETLALLRERNKTLLAALRYTAARTKLATEQAKMTALVKDFKHLRQLRSVIRRHGLNRSLLAFVNPNPAAVSKTIPALPATESLDIVSVHSGDPRVKTATTSIEAMIATESALVADWVSTCADNADVMLSSTSDQLDGIDDAVGHYLDSLADNDGVDQEALAGSTIAAVPCGCAKACAEALLSAIPSFNAAVPDPTDRDAVDAHREKLSGLAATLGTHTGLTVDPENPNQLQFDGAPQATVPVSDTFAAHGYSVEAVIALLENADDLIEALQALVEQKDDIVTQLRNTATVVAAIDNDVPPAVDGAYFDDDQEDDEPASESIFGCGMTQADLIHSHVSSHLCCIAALTDCGIRSVQNALCLAQHVKTFGTPAADPEACH